MLYAGNCYARTHYEVLSVNEDASYDEIRESYKAAILRCHPDKFCGKSVPPPLEEQNELFLTVRKAWEVLSNPQSRENYDNVLQDSRNEVEVVECEVGLEEMMVRRFHGDEREELSYQCRCGDYFLLNSAELEELWFLAETLGLTQACVILPCSSCSLKIRLVVDVKNCIQSLAGRKGAD